MKYQLVFFAVSIFYSYSGHSQTCQNGRYQLPVFSEVNVTTDIVYGSADQYDLFNLNIPIDLKLDFYEPADDTLAKRPLIIMMFGGAFIGGDKSFTDMVAWGDSLARYGYTVASINYRLGFNLLNGESAIRAVYRAMQDCRAAVRYLKEFHQLFQIDTTKIFLGGNSAGSVTAIHTAFLTEEEDRPQSTFGITTPFSNEPDDLGCPDCSGNEYNHTVEIAGIINLWGAIYDTTFIDIDEQIPMLHIHGTDDGIVPFEFGAPFGGIFPLPGLYGSKPIHERLDHLGIYNEFYPFADEGHAFYLNGLFMNAYWEPVFQLGKNFLWNLQEFPTASFIYQIDGNEVSFTNLSENGNSWLWNFGNNQTSNEEHPMQSFEPGTHVIALTVTNAAGCESIFTDTITLLSTSTLFADNGNLSLKLSPNPARDYLQLTFTSTEAGIAEIDIINVNGEIIQNSTQHFTPETDLIPFNTNNLLPGCYFVRVQTKSQTIINRFIKH